VQGSIPLDLDMEIHTKFSLQVEFSQYVGDPDAGLSTNAIRLKVDTFQIGATLSSNDINVTGLNLLGQGNLDIVGGSASIGAILNVGVAGSTNTISLANVLTTSPFTSLLAYTPALPFHLDLPGTLNVSGSQFTLSGDFALKLQDNDLLTGAAPNVELTVTGGLLSVSHYAYLAGDFALQFTPTATVQLSGGDPSVTKPVSVLEIGASNVNLFAGLSTAAVDPSQPLPAGTRGFLVSNASFALALLTPTATGDTTQYYDLHASGSMQTVGLPAGVGISASTLSVDVNDSTDPNHVVDFAASSPGNQSTNTPAGLGVLRARRRCT
jgi:hypothetical protein